MRSAHGKPAEGLLAFGFVSPNLDSVCFDDFKGASKDVILGVSLGSLPLLPIRIDLFEKRNVTSQFLAFEISRECLSLPMGRGESDHWPQKPRQS